MARKEIDRKLMLDYLQGNCTVEQLYIIQEWLNDEAYRASLDEFLREEWGGMNRQSQPAMQGLDEQYEKFRSYLKQESPVPGTVVSTTTKVIRLPLRIAGIAAALLILLVAGWLLQSRRGRGKGEAQAEQWVVFHNQPGKKQQLLLPDSSIVYVASASTLKYNMDFSRTHRRILLEGEAYFVVKHDASLPFTVVTGDIRTVDVGTEFNIRSYPDRPSIEVAVAKGKVEIQHEKGIGAPIGALGQGQMLQYDPLTTKAVTVSLPDAGMVGAWRKGILSFRKQPLKEVTDELEKYYGISIRYADPAYEQILLTTLLDNNSLEEAMEIVTVTAGVHYTRQGDTIVLK